MSVISCCLPVSLTLIGDVPSFFGQSSHNEIIVALSLSFLIVLNYVVWCCFHWKKCKRQKMQHWEKYLFFFFSSQILSPSGQSPMSDLTTKVDYLWALWPFIPDPHEDHPKHWWRHTHGEHSPMQPGTETVHVSKVSSVKYPVADDRYSSWDECDQGEKKVGCLWCWGFGICNNVVLYYCGGSCAWSPQAESPKFRALLAQSPIGSLDYPEFSRPQAIQHFCFNLS